jgi:hypothetical protein
MFSIYLEDQRKYVRFIILLREPAARDLSWFSVGEGIQTSEWWIEKKKKCGSTQFSAANCYDESVNSAINSWNQCVVQFMSVYGQNCNKDMQKCLNLFENSESIMAELYGTCSINNRLAQGIYVGQLANWIRYWENPRLFFIVIADDLITRSSETVGNIMNHVTERVDSPRNWTGKVPVENSTKKKKDYLNVRNCI